MSTLKREIIFKPAYDMRSDDPKKNFGIHGVEMLWVLKGSMGAVQFLLFTNWQLPNVDRERDRDNTLLGKYPHLLCRPMPADLGYHSRAPRYEGQGPTFEKCDVLGGVPCYYDGSGLNAERVYKILVEKGGEAAWEELERYYTSTFMDDA